MSIEVAFFTEASRVVGTGHFVETLNLAAVATVEGLSVVIVAPAGTPAALLEQAPPPVHTVADLTPDSLGRAAAALAAGGVRVAVTNFRRVSAAQVAAIRNAGLRVVCIDELGGSHLPCEAVINPSPLPTRHRYSSDTSDFKLYTGLEYLALSEEYTQLRTVSREIEGGVGSLVISLGGADRSGATARVVEALLDWPSAAVRHIVLGAAFAGEDSVERIVNGLSRWRVHRNPRGLAELLSAADVGITAGGNTLFEMACVGTPALVLHEDDHEAEQGRALEAAGFAVWLGRGTDVPAARIREALDELDDTETRRARSHAGQRLVDGRGSRRICAILMEQLSRDSAVTT